MKCPQCAFENRPQAKFSEEDATPLVLARQLGDYDGTRSKKNLTAKNIANTSTDFCLPFTSLLDVTMCIRYS
jgi:hypothetical protein